MTAMAKQDGAFLTIGELATELGVPHHILRYWESRFPALRPLQRAGNRRYYRPEDVELARTIHRLLSIEGYTVKGAQQALSGRVSSGQISSGQASSGQASSGGEGSVSSASTLIAAGEDAQSLPAAAQSTPSVNMETSALLNRLEAIREKLRKALVRPG